jgi:hypothetical protein
VENSSAFLLPDSGVSGPGLGTWFKWQNIWQAQGSEFKLQYQKIKEFTHYK